MTDELTQYENDRPGWLAVVAPKQAARIADDTYDDTLLAYVWSAMPRDYQAAVLPYLTDAKLQAVWASMPRDDQTAVWALLPEPQRERIRKLRGGKA